MASEGAVLIAAISARALAASARRAGYLPLVADLFGDEDTLLAAQVHVRLAGELALGLEEEALIGALEALDPRHATLGLVCGTGFESKTALLDRLARHWRLLGNGAETVAKAKNPAALFRICADFGIPFAEWSISQPSAPAGWLAKRKGGAGGSHIAPAAEAKDRAADIYFQREMPGIPIAALFLADGVHAAVLGFTEQWSLPAPGRPYRYGGAVRPAALSARIIGLLTAAVRRLVPALALVGLNSADFLVDSESFCLLEINPRPGATFDIFDLPQHSLFAAHLAACDGRLTTVSDYPDGAQAAAICYAEQDIPCVPRLDWPDWTADRPAVRSAIKAGQPVCTVYADGSVAAQARALAEQRRRTILARIASKQ